MIGRLRGRVEEIEEDSVILDVGGVGYHVFCSGRTLGALAPGEAASLVIETQVREDHIHLYGFSDTLEREWFRTLTTVQRVGSRMALTILGAYPPAQLSRAIVAKDTSAFSRISGIGPKLAERIVTELKDKAVKLPTETFEPVSSKVAGKTEKKKDAGAPTDEAISALVNLGYSRSEAYAAALRAQESAPALGLTDLIRASLKELARKDEPA